MNWDYLAGYFDGDGSTSIAVVRKKGRIMSLHPMLVFNGSEGTIDEIRDFLHSHKTISDDNRTYPTAASKKNHWGSEWVLQINATYSVERLCQELGTLVLEKKRHLQILLEILTIKKQLKAEGKQIIDNLNLFIPLRNELHSLAKKGRKELLPLQRQELRSKLVREASAAIGVTK